MTLAPHKTKILFSGFIVVVLATVVMCSKQSEHYQPLDTLPAYQHGSKPQDGDTQADTIKALQAYAKAAVGKANDLNQRTEDSLRQVLENKHQIARLVDDSEQAKALHQQTTQRLKTVLDQLTIIQRQLDDQVSPILADGEDLPVGFGFDDLKATINPNQGTWHNPIDHVAAQESSNYNTGFQRLLTPPTNTRNSAAQSQSRSSSASPDAMINPAYTLAKDTMLTDAVALTALIGRIPVKGTTPDPYPVKFFVGKENLAANGHQLPEVEGMLFSGIAFGDWNLSCVNARLTSATYIFTDGSIVNHSQQDKPLGYISDPSGNPCVAGEFVTNAPQFLLNRAAISGLGAAGSAYSNAQKQTQTSTLTGTTTSTLLGNIDKVVAGDVVQSATDDINQWLLERQQQSFDAVVVNPGKAVVIHLDTTLTIDHNTLARKIRYAKDHQTHHSYLD